MNYMKNIQKPLAIIVTEPLHVDVLEGKIKIKTSTLNLITFQVEN